MNSNNKIKDKIIYQIYPLSFFDGDGSGNGNIKGINQKIKYLKWLGITDIWLSPIYETSFIDNGYDVINYKKIDKVFGGDRDFKKLINTAKKEGIGIIMDMVLNHTSVENNLFKKSIKNKGKYKDFYIWRNIKNNLESQFGNSSWTFNNKRKMFYFNHFSKYQPDLNWQNPKVINYFAKIIKYWMRKGVSGFRFDVIDMLGKNPDSGKIINIDEAYEIINILKKKSWGKKKDLFTVGEAWSTSRDNTIKYVNINNGSFSTLFNDRKMFIGWDESRWDAKPFNLVLFNEFKNYIFETIEKYRDNVNYSIFVENHDFPRSISRWFPKGDHNKIAKIIATSFYGLKGIPFIYNGQEAGLPNPTFKSVDKFNDIETNKFINNNFNESDVFIKASFGSRDNARAMIPWNNETYIKKNWNPNAFYPKHKIKTIEQQINDDKSTLNHYRFLIDLRKKHKNLFSCGIIKKIESEKSWIFGYTISNKEKEFIFVSNWSSKEQVIGVNLSKYKKNKRYKNKKSNRWTWILYWN